MSYELDRVLDAERRAACLAHDAELARAMFPALEPRQQKLRAFLINIGERAHPRLSFGCMAHSSADAVDQNLCLAEDGERVEAIPVRSEPFPIAAARHQLAEAQLREVQS